MKRNTKIHWNEKKSKVNKVKESLEQYYEMDAKKTMEFPVFFADVQRNHTGFVELHNVVREGTKKGIISLPRENVWILNFFICQ